MKAVSLKVNIAAMTGLQIATYIIPFVTLPYLTRVLGVDEWGKIAFAQVVVQFLTILVDYAFSWSATRDVAVARDSKSQYSSIFWSTFFAQLLLLGISFIIVAALGAFVNWESIDAQYLLVASISLVGQLLFPQWLLQGLENLKALAVIQVASRCVLILPVFILVSGPQDAKLALFIQSVSGVIAGIFTFAYFYKKKIVIWVKPSFSSVYQVLRQGTSLFLSKVWIALYTNCVPFLLGVVAGHEAVGFYKLAERFRTAAQSLLRPFAAAIFPRMSHLQNSNEAEAGKLLKISLMLVIGIGGSASLSLFLLSEYLVLLLAGEAFLAAVPVLEILSIVPLVVGISNVLGTQVMIAKGKVQPFNRIILSGAILALLVVYPFCYYFGANGAALTTLSAEFLVTILMFIYIKKSNYI
ncbi:flippase [Pseudoalteromonas sp. DL2-H2.2]|uniref:flippase n=1 Tax=Pseudoalteromonas sp. DL2-H2.2 TaxID=2908889 RepID=UPI001F2756DB|nr:flippase [Pseudoalteromonas sp. DL2-H2.2]MCF2908824.1 flippase [Pseudoalteromonas sp. DL2-H2.2]